METCFVNLVEPDDTVVVCQNGVFGGRMKENVIRCGGTPVMVEDPWGRAVDVSGPAEDVWVPSFTRDRVEAPAQSKGTSFAVATVAGVAALWLAVPATASAEVQWSPRPSGG